MNYDEAREILGKGWHWTTMNNGVVRTAQPCITILKPFDPTSPDFSLKASDITRCPPHATKEDAERHYYDWCLSTVTEIKLSNQQLRCRAEGCEAWTDTELGNRQPERMFNGDPLCDEHRTRETLALIHPFRSPLGVIHS